MLPRQVRAPGGGRRGQSVRLTGARVYVPEGRRHVRTARVRRSAYDGLPEGGLPEDGLSEGGLSEV